MTTWRAEDAEALVPGVMAAAGYQVERSREHTKEETWAPRDVFQAGRPPVDMMDIADVMPTSPQAQQRSKVVLTA